uniref:(northern house mosquito) hypothetical protein n=1 Tax=Culex pipiens TaxID=7175 RepID=A0A8D8FG80_CULPI
MFLRLCPLRNNEKGSETQNSFIEHAFNSNSNQNNPRNPQNKDCSLLNNSPPKTPDPIPPARVQVSDVHAESAPSGRGPAQYRRVAWPFGRIRQTCRSPHPGGAGGQKRRRGDRVAHQGGSPPQVLPTVDVQVTSGAEAGPLQLAQVYVGLEQRHHHAAPLTR